MSPPFAAFVSNTIARVPMHSPPTLSQWRITAGYANEVETGPSAGRHNQAGYLEARYQFGRRLTAIAGGRVEANGFFGTRFVPRVGASYALRFGSGFWGATRLRASYGEGIKEPDILPHRLQSHLKPEQSTTFDAGIDQFFDSDRIHLRPLIFTTIFATSSALPSAARRPIARLSAAATSTPTKRARTARILRLKRR